MRDQKITIMTIVNNINAIEGGEKRRNKWSNKKCFNC